MANTIKGFRKGQKVKGMVGPNKDEEVRGVIEKVNCKGKAVVSVEGRGKIIIPLHSLTKETTKAKRAGAAKTKTATKKKETTKKAKAESPEGSETKKAANE